MPTEDIAILNELGAMPTAVTDRRRSACYAYTKTSSSALGKFSCQIFQLSRDNYWRGKSVIRQMVTHSPVGITHHSDIS
ncbi:hypothetical protein [Nostoc sp. ChiSLP03a]|uniref:hypothetical protein n=1 Tax=Nostoc sp. ChiSLP03a TaxID=3075380 RepID=UPI002AD51FD6|nr:hypothetical protein [Nostoc sp. ChiSLP03a]MDZ8216533.1 hypothetical protein [Nostoc sp. ChiSLP03a]